MVIDQQIIPLKYGLYETDKHCEPASLASVLYGPSYLSFEYVLSKNGLIPERVFVYSSACFRKNRTKQFKNAFGIYTYRNIPVDVFPYGVQLMQDGERFWSQACPEKALCDVLYEQRPLEDHSRFSGYLFDGLRLDEEAFESLDQELMLFLASRYRKKNLRYLERLIKERRTV